MFILAIVIGGALGALSRFYISLGISNTFSGQFPIGILLVNILGSFLIGICLVLVEKSMLSDFQRMLIIVGFLGSLTTFSSFSYDTFTLLSSGKYLYALINVLLNNILSILMLALAVYTTKKIIS